MRVNEITLTDAGELYTSIPTVTIGLPDHPASNAAATVLVDSSGVVTSVTILDSGAYYTNAPNVTVPPTPDATVQNNFTFEPSEVKFKEAAYALGRSDRTDSDFTNFSAGQNNNLSIEFFLKVPTRGFDWPVDGDAFIMRFKTPADSTGTNNYVEIHDSDSETSVVWNWTNAGGTGTSQIRTNGSDLANSNFHFVQLTKRAANGDSGGPIHEIHIDGGIKATSGEQDSSNNDSNISNSITLVNDDNTWKGDSAGDLSLAAIIIDNVKLRTFDSGGAVDFPPPPDSDRTTDSNFESFTACAAEVTATLDSEGMVNALTVVSGGSKYLANQTLTLTIDSAQGTNSDFRATAVALLDSSTNRLSGFTITDSGGGYDTDPTVSIAVPLNIIDFTVGETVNQTLSDGVIMAGEVLKWSDSDKKLHVAHSGASDGKYHSWTTNIAVTGASSAATGSVTAVTEDNQISENEQNDAFDTIGDSFLDFTESNPFGDPQ